MILHRIELSALIKEENERNKARSQIKRNILHPQANKRVSTIVKSNTYRSENRHRRPIKIHIRSEMWSTQFPMATSLLMIELNINSVASAN